MWHTLYWVIHLGFEHEKVHLGFFIRCHGTS